MAMRRRTRARELALQLLYQLDLRGEDVLAIQRAVRRVEISDALLRYVTAVVRATRPGEGAPEPVTRYLRWGAGPRAGQALVLCAKARALLHGRFAVTLPDIRAIAPSALRHRLLLNFQAEADDVGADEIIERVFEAVPEPRSPLA